MNKKSWKQKIALFMAFVLMVSMSDISSIFVLANGYNYKAGLKNPIIVEDSSSNTKQKVTWDCVYFGNYPQAEVINNDINTNYTSLDSKYIQDGDIIVSDTIYDELQKSTEWNHNEIILDGKKYFRMLKDEAFYTSDDSGYYWSDSTTYHYFQYQPIKWRVLNVNGTSAFLLSDKILDNYIYDLDFMEYNHTWERSAIRTLLNAYDSSQNDAGYDYNYGFLKKAFSQSEQTAIKNTLIINEDNPYTGTSSGIEGGKGGNNTYDKIFLLALSDVYATDKAASYGFFKENYNDEARQCLSTTYAKANGTLLSSENKTCDWWLRSPGWRIPPNGYNAVKVSDGYIGIGGEAVNAEFVGERPALYLDLSYSDYYTYAGTVCSDGTYDENPKNDTGLSNDIVRFTLSETASATLKDNSFTFSGHIYLEEGKTASSEEWQSIVNSINWNSSDTSVVTDIKCQPVTNGNEQGDIEITVSVSLKSAGTATVTGTTSNGLAASCEVTVEDKGIVSSFSLDSTKTGTLDSPFPVFGTLTFNNDMEVTRELIEKEVNAIRWNSSDQDILPDSAIKCSSSNTSNSHSINLMLMLTAKKKGKVTITGTASNGMTASCDITIGGCIVINQKASDLEGCTIALSGTLALEETTEASEASLQEAIDSLKFESSDDSKATVLVCNVVKSKDYKSATLEIWTTLYNKGTATITVTAADGHKSKCEITIAENNSGDITNYEGDYTSKMSEFLSNKGTFNTLEYLCNDVNFTASTFVAEKDTQVGELIVKNITNTFYRGWDGWRDLIDGSTSVEQAEKIIASLLDAYQAKIGGLSQIKTAHKYAKMLNNAFSDYSNALNLFKAMNSDEIEVVKKYFSESNLARLLYEGKYDEIIFPVNQILQDEKMHQIWQAGTQSEVFKQGSEAAKSWNKMMENFTKSGEISKKLKEGFKAKLGKLEIGGGLDHIGKALNWVSFAQDTVNNLYQLEALLTANEMYCEMLLYIKENCVYDVVQKAAGNLYSVINDGVEGIIADVSEKAKNKVGKEVFKEALNIACKKSLPFTIIKAGFDWGVNLSNTFFKTGQTQELKDSLRSQACLANCLGNWVQSNAKDYLSSIDTDHKMEKGKELYYSLYMLWEARKNAEETLQSLLKTTHAGLSANYSVSTRITSTLESFQKNIFTEENMESLLAISVSCPVDVEVYDEKGVKLLTVKDGTECQGYEKGIYYYCAYNPLASDYDKYIYYSEDKNYNVKIVGNDLGLADCSVSRVDDNGYLSEFYFENKKIDKNTVIELYNISKEGVGYKVTDLNGSEISNSMESRKADKIATVSISLNTDSLELIAGNSQLLAVSFTPANAANQKVVWTSDNDAVVSVNNDGVITAKAVGTAVVTVSQGDLEQRCKITVKKNTLQDNDNKNPSGSGTGGNTGSGGGGGGAGTTSTSAPIVTLTPSPSPTPVTIATTEPTLKPSASTKPGTGSDNIFNNNSKKEITPADVTLNKKTIIYSGKEKKPGVTVLSGSLELIKDKEYTVSYSYNINVGTAYVNVYGKGDYYGSVTKSFKIIPRGTPLKGKVKPRHKGFAVKWKKQPKSITGYQVQYSTDKKFKGKTTVIRTVKKKSVTKLTVNKLKAKKKYYVRVRTYKTVKGKKYYSRWSKSKVVKTKK